MRKITTDLRTAEDREWLAMRYVLSELTPEDNDTFERAMEHDVELCDAVVSATRMVSAIRAGRTQFDCSAESTMPRHRKSPIRSGLTGSIILASVCILLFVLRPESFETRIPDDEVVAAFASLISDGDVALAAMDSDSDSATSDSVDSLEAPDWLLTAIELESASSVAPKQDNDQQVF